MFSKLVLRNSKKSRKENGLFFSSLIVSIVAFYIVLSLSHQDVMVFLRDMESDAVSKLLTMIPAFYGATLFILFFLVYYASKFQLERRRHEFGVYLMMGMRRTKLFGMLLSEDFFGSIAALAVGLPIAVLLSELISLVTAKSVGLGIVGHETSFSMEAVLWTVAGFLTIKCIAFLILSGKISREEIEALLVPAPEGTKKQRLAPAYGIALTVGAVLLTAAYAMAINGKAWSQVLFMMVTLFLGILGTFLVFWGMQYLIGLWAKKENHDRPLHAFNFRQIQETVMHRSGTLAVCSLLILAALCCFAAGVSIANFRDEGEPHVLDYTFEDPEVRNSVEAVKKTLRQQGMDNKFSHLFEIRTGYINTTQDYENAFQMEQVTAALNAMEPSETRENLMNNLRYATYPYLIPLSEYNELLTVAGLPTLEVGENEAGVYMDTEFASWGRKELLDSVLKTKPEAIIDNHKINLTGTVQTTNIVTDRATTLSFALIIPDDQFDAYTQETYKSYLNGVLAPELTENQSLMMAFKELSGELDRIGVTYESYLQNSARYLFYMVASSYITIYLAIIFLIMGNTIIGVQFLMGQQKAHKRYKTLVRLGATYEILCQSSKKQINWYFGIPTVVAAISSLFGVRALFSGLLFSAAKENLPQMMAISGAMILLVCVVECIYMIAVKRSSSSYLLTLMVPEREE